MIRRARSRSVPEQGTEGAAANGARRGKQAEVAADAGAAPARVRRLRRRVTRLEARNDALRERLAKQERELELLRGFTLDVFPDLEVPERVRRVVERVKAEDLTFLETRQLKSLVACVLEAEAAGREGLVVEAGTARGGSAIAMAAAKHPARPMRVYDVFGMIPPPTERDGDDVQARYEEIAAGRARGRGDEVYYGYRDDLEGEVRASFSRLGVPVESHHVELVKGLFEESMVIDEPVALAHVDGDWYSSTITCLEAIAPHVVPGGRIVVDDYWTWSGCRTAVDEYFAGRSEFRVEMRAKVHAVRLR